jgi:protein TonB
MTVELIKVAFFFSLISQDTIPVQEKIYTVSEVSTKPTPAKGLTNFHDRWSKIVVYPERALKEKVQGIVFIQFVVNNDGTVTDASIKQGIGHGCEEAALKGFNEVCKEPWKPGVRHGQPVKVSMVLPFYFRILERP